MIELLNKILRPIFSAAFRYVYPRIPWHKEILWFFARYYFVQDVFQCGEVAEELTSKGYGVFLNYCTEDANTFADVKDAACMYRNLISIAAARNVSGGRVVLSIKMSQFGCFWEDPEAGRTLERVIDEAVFKHVRIMLDGERLMHVECVVKFATLMNERYGNVGVRLQAYNPDFFSLLQGVIREDTNAEEKMFIGICKGAYHEERACSTREIRRNFVAGVFRCLEQSQPVSIDTHDESLVHEIDNLVAAEGPVQIRPSFGLLYNVKPWLARKLQARSGKVFIYLPVVRLRPDDQSPQWEKFAIRRLLERPTYIFLPFKLLLDRFLGHATY